MTDKFRDSITAEQLVRWRGKRTQPEAAAELNTPVETYRNWEKRKRSIPGIVKRTIELLRRLHRNRNSA